MTRYVNELGQIAPEIYGCCDRKNHCGYNNRPDSNTKPSPIKVPPPLPISYTDPGMVNKDYKHNNLYLFLKNKFGSQEANKACKMYEIGSSEHWPMSTIFWFKDIEMRYRGGMIIKYNTNGKRVREPFSHNTYVHKALKMQGYNYSMCLFGEHLVKSSVKTIAIVEAPKSAIIGNIMWPDYLWIATNGLTTLQPYFLEPLKGRDIVLFPDKQPDEFSEQTQWIKDYWIKKIPSLQKICKSVTIFDPLYDTKEGTDIADILID